MAGIFDTDLGNTLMGRFLDPYMAWRRAGRLGHATEFATVICLHKNPYMNGDIVIIDSGSST